MYPVLNLGKHLWLKEQILYNNLSYSLHNSTITMNYSGFIMKQNIAATDLWHTQLATPEGPNGGETSSSKHCLSIFYYITEFWFTPGNLLTSNGLGRK